MAEHLPSRKKALSSNRDWSMAQVQTQDPEFKPQYGKKRKQKKK
jgi:hypothetical protein